MKQVCVSCWIEKDISLFEWASNRPSPRKKCKECRYKARDARKENEAAKQRKKEWHVANKETIYRNAEKRLYGVSKDEFNYKECWICSSTDRLCIDHCHSTGKVRGLLCSKCNTALGYFDDSSDKMKRAIEYLNTNPHFELDRKVYP